MTIQEAAALLRARKVSSVELTQEALARIAAINPKLNAFLTQKPIWLRFALPSGLFPLTGCCRRKPSS